MPHQCIKCSQIFADEHVGIMCSCGAKAFLFIKSPRPSVLPEEMREGLLAFAQERQIVIDPAHIICKDGTYEIDLAGVAGNANPVVQYDEGKYRIDLDIAMKKK
jgi:predicted  nucleic acid-binding Zn-ribbon protein